MVALRALLTGHGVAVAVLAAAGSTVALAVPVAGSSQVATPPKAKLSLSRRAGPPGTRVRLRGRGFPRRARVLLRFGGKRLRTVRARRSGRFRLAFRVPPRRPGVYGLVARARGRSLPPRRRVARIRFRVTPASPPGSGAGPNDPVATATYTNPVFPNSAPDPGVMRDGSGYYYAYTTGSLFPVLRSVDLVQWTRIGTALAQRPSWVVASGDSHPWAPSVLRSSRACPGGAAAPCYFLYYVGLSGQHTPATHCVGVAYSTTPGGPFTDLGPIPDQANATDASGRPPGCGDDAGYSNIDPAPFVDVDGRVFLYLTTDRGCAAPAPGQECPLQPTISVIPLTDDLVRAAGPRKPLFGGDAGTWEQSEAPTVENPWMERRSGRYYLFYSGGSYLGAYGMGYATASAAMGDSGPTPFTKSPQNPILEQAAGGPSPGGGSASVLSPGGGSLVRGPQGGDWLVYHGRTGGYAEPRTLRIDRVVWNSDGTPSTSGPNSDGPVSVKGPTATPQSPVP